MTNKRKHVRVPYEQQVELVTDGQTFIGKSIDISSSGIKVVATIPVSRLAVHGVACKLTLVSDSIQIPCKIARKHRTRSDIDEHVIGLEFSCRSESQIMLIDRSIRNMKSILDRDESGRSDLRAIPRVSCNLTGITCSDDGAAVTSLDNISTEGCLIRYEGRLNTRDTITLGITLPGDRRRIAATGTVTYVISNDHGGSHRAGLLFSGISDIDSVRIRNFIINHAASTAIQSIHEKKNQRSTGNENSIRDPDRIAGLFRLLKKENRNINVLFEKSTVMGALAMETIDVRHRYVATSSNPDIGGLDLKKDHAVYGSFYLHGSSYFFSAAVIEAGEMRLVLTFPEVLRQSDKRSHERAYPDEETDVSLELEDPPSVRFHGTVVNVSRRGFLCTVVLKSRDTELFTVGRTVSYFFKSDLGLDTFGEIRHVREEKTDDGGTLLLVGVEAGIRRTECSYMRYGQARWSRAWKSMRRSMTGASRRIVSDVVRYRNRDGKEITALVNHTGGGGVAPVVILPPAFGKKKETLSPLVATLLENFRRFHKDLVTIRYDGINRPGESSQEDMCPKRGYEMLRYRISQGLDDLEATMEFAFHTPLFRPGAVIVVAFSMSALDARKLAVKDPRVTYLINVMGVTCARSSFTTITGGIDIIDNARNGIESGLSGVMGHILDLDSVARDLIVNRYACLADARHDMSRISIPVSWIYGKHDRWVIPREIMDLMSVGAEGRREVIEIPTGHNLRSSEDALRTFRLVTRMIYRHLHHRNIRAVEPDRDCLVSLVTRERERLRRPEDVNIREYWKDYLMGENRNSIGYDFYRNFDEFSEFLSVQGSLLDPKNGEIMADMGCGTGIFMERMLLDRAEQGIDMSDARLVQVDLVSEALVKTREKYVNIKERYGDLAPRSVDFIQMDLEPNRLLPVMRFVKDRTLTFDYLRNRVEGLKHVTIDRLSAGNSERLHSIMRGDVIGEEDRLFLKRNFSAEDCRAVVDFNRAARLLSGNDVPGEIARTAVGKNGPIGGTAIRNDESEVSDLKFGSPGRALALCFRDCTFDKIAGSLLISYIFNPDEIIHEFYRILKPDGRLLVSSMRPDGDISAIFTNYIDKVWNHFSATMSDQEREKNLMGARSMLNEAASLLELEEDGHFRFFSKEELSDMLAAAGFVNIAVTESLGNPPQAIIVTGSKPVIGRWKGRNEML